jgi:uncharacterized protein (TIGR02118 family)
MIKVSIMYPNSPGARFDHDYYRDQHLPLIQRRMGAALKYYTIDKGLTGGTPDASAPYLAMCHLLCDSIEAYQSAFGPHAQEIRADIHKFTDQTPVRQVSKVVVENSAKASAAEDHARPEWTPELKQEIVIDALRQVGGRSFNDIARQRDEALVALLKQRIGRQPLFASESARIKKPLKEDPSR